MSVWTDAALTAIYTLSPMHFGIGQAASAVDLPIAREAGSGLPLLPATGLKGVARDFLGMGEEPMPRDEIERLFGPDLDKAEGAEHLRTGELTFGEARLAAYPVRSLNRPFLHATCPLIVERLARDLKAANTGKGLIPDVWQPDVIAGQALVADRNLAGAALVLEDLVYEPGATGHSAELADFSAALAGLLPAGEEATRKRLREGLVMVSDQDFADLMARVVPVRARIKLTGGKTTDTWEGPDGPETGNLWYEEHLPPDCLFLALVGQRRQRTRGGPVENGQSEHKAKALELLRKYAHLLGVVQAGGNETVGYGLCWWSGWEQGGVS